MAVLDQDSYLVSIGFDILKHKKTCNPNPQKLMNNHVEVFT